MIPAYRAAATIRRAVDSVLAQTHPPTEVMVVDDGSPDDLAGAVKYTYGERVILLRQSNAGAASARNVGIDRATGAFIAFLDADDYWEPDKLAQQFALFARHPELGLVAGTYYEETPGLPRSDRPVLSGPPRWYDRVLSLDGPRSFRLATSIWTGTVLLKREALQHERFVTGLEPAEDRDLWVRVVSRRPAYLTTRAMATAVLVDGSLSRSSIDRDKANMLRVVERHRALLGPIWTRIWVSHTLYRWAALDPRVRSALPRLFHSMWLWPLPYTTLVDRHSLGRLRCLAELALATIGQRGRLSGNTGANA